MRLRIFLILFLILLVGAVAVVLVVSNFGGLTLFNGGNANNGDTATTQNEGTPQAEPGLPLPTATPELRFVEVLVARVRLRPGDRISQDLLTVEFRPEDNVAVRANYTFSNPEELEGVIVGTEIAPGQAILTSMLALNPTDLTASGSDLSLYVNRGNVAVAFPIDPYTGIGYAMRPGDKIDVMMTLVLQRVDEEFQSALPNQLAIVDPDALLNGTAFLFEDTVNGRLEFIPEINKIGFIIPGGLSDGEFIIYNRAVTQLTIQRDRKSTRLNSSH